MSTISADWVNPFIIAATEVLNEIVGVKPKLSKPYAKQTDEPLFDISGIIGLTCLLYTSPSPRDRQKSRMPSSA